MIDCLHGKDELTQITIHGGQANVWTSDPVINTTLARLAQDHPDQVRINKAHPRADGVSQRKIDWIDYDLPAGWITLHCPAYDDGTCTDDDAPCPL